MSQQPTRGGASHRLPMLTAAAVAVLSAQVAPATAAVDLLSHRAAYRLSLARSDGQAGIEAVRGALVLEWQADCSGWLSNQRLAFAAETAEGPGFAYDVRFASWESPDSTRMRFSVRTFDDGALAEAHEGVASLPAPGGPGEARYREPDNKTLALPPGTLFPTAHVRRLVAAARSGASLVSDAVFDGSGPDALSTVTAVIGPRRAAPAGEPARWPVSLAYHAAEKSDETPQFQLSFELGEDGVLRRLMLDYGDFALAGEVEEVEPLATPSCE